MAKQTINTGTTPADHTGDSVRTAFDKVNANFSELYEAAGNAASADELEEHVNDTNNPHGVTKSQVGLGSVDNTSDANKPVSTATQTALNAKATTTALDAETAARIAADALKADLASPAFSGNPTAPTQTSDNNSNRLATTAFVQTIKDEIIGGAPGTFDTLSELAAGVALSEDAAAALTTAVAARALSSRTVNGHPLTSDVTVTKADVGLGSADNTPDTGKPVSTAQQTALDLKQNRSSLGADSAAAVHAATSKTTPADGDEIGAADSAASFGLKRFTWANIKAALKTYFDGLYNNYVLPAPGTTTLGGVKRNAGSAGEFVNGIDSNGALTYATPAGGGGSGGALVRGSGVLKGNTTPHGSATPVSGYSINTVSSIGSGTLTVDVNGTVLIMTFDTTNPWDGSVFIDITSFSGSLDYAQAIESQLASYFAASLTNISRNEFNVTFDSLSSGSSVYVNATTTMTNISTSGYVNGTDGAEGYGAVLEVEIIPAVIGKTLYPLRVWGVGDGIGMNMDVCLKEGGIYYPLCNEFYAGTSAWENINGTGSAQFGPYAVRWFNGVLSASLVARLLGESVADGGTTTIYATCEQQVP